MDDNKKFKDESMSNKNSNIENVEMSKYKPLNIEDFYTIDDNFEGKVIGVIGSKGGVGTTFITSHLAVICSKNDIANDFESEAILVDLNLENGDIKTIFNQTDHAKDIGDLTPILNELSNISVENVVEKTNNGLSIIFSTNNLEKAKEFKEDNINHIVKILKKLYKYVFLDIPNNLNLCSAKAGINVSDELILITIPHLLSVIRCNHLLEQINSLKNGAITHLVVNRSDSFSAISLKHIEQFLKVPIFKTIPEDLTLGIMFEQKGTILSDRTDLSLIRSMGDLARKILNFKNS